MTDEERKQIVSDVLAALKQNSTTIDQMLEKENCADDDFFETNKGNKISFKTLSKGYNEEQGAVGDAVRYQFKRSDGKKLYPQTSSACVTMSDGDDSLDTRVKNITTEYNVSLFHPKQGIDGSNKYTLSSAIALVPEKYRSIGIKCSFINEAGSNETWEYLGGKWDVTCFGQIGNKKLLEQDIKIKSSLGLDSYAKAIQLMPINGKGINLNGLVYDNPKTSIAEISNLSDIEALSIFTYTNSGFCNIAYYDADNNVLSKAGPLSGESSDQLLILEKPKGAIIARLCWITNKEYKAFSVSKRIARLEELVILDSNIIAKTIYSGAYLKNDGKTVVGFEHFSYAEIDVTGVGLIEVGGTHFAQGCSLCFKDYEGNIIGHIRTVDDTEYTVIKEYVPDNAVKAYTSYRYNHTLDRKPYILVYSKVELERLSDLINNGYYKSFKDVTAEIGLTVGSANSASDGNPISNANWAKTDKILVDNIDIIKIYTRFSNAICYVKWIGNDDIEILPRGIGNNADGYKFMEFYKPSNAVYAEISVIDINAKNYIVEFGRISHSEANDNNGILQQDLYRNMSNINMVPIFGQSLSVGAAATPCITKQSKYPAGIMFSTGMLAAQKDVSYFTEYVPLQERDGGVTVDSAGTGETVASGCLEQVIELFQKENGVNAYSHFWDSHKFLFVSCGVGSKTISELMSEYYEGLVNAIKGGLNVAVKKQYTFNVPAVIYIQGETDQKAEGTDYESYKNQLSEFATKINTSVKTLTGQKNDVKVILYQTCSQNIVSTIKHPTYNNTAMDIPTAQMELVRDNDMFIACNPAYILDHSGKEMIHLSAVGEKMMGAYCGISLHSVICKDEKKRGLTPNSFSIEGNNIKIKYNVPSPPLRFNTSFVKEVEYMGFSVIDSSDNNIINNVSVFDDEVTIECTESPIGCKLYYGFNGAEYRDGRKEGSRGNLCDNADKIYSAKIDDKEYALSNYSYSFCVLVE